MFTLTICSIGTVDTVRTQHNSEADARNALEEFARGYEIHGTESGTLTTKCGRVNQASYTWNIRIDVTEYNLKVYGCECGRTTCDH
jgi:hypothetical protein